MTLYIPKHGDRVRVVAVSPDDPSPQLKVGDVVTTYSAWKCEIECGGMGYISLMPDVGIQQTYCHVEPYNEPEAELARGLQSAKTDPLVYLGSFAQYADDAPAQNLTDVLEAVQDEYIAAALAYPPFNSAHEGYALLLEEVEELWDEIKTKQGDSGRLDRIRAEAIQVAAMAVRIVMDCKED
jgi:hypothetical protein